MCSVLGLDASSILQVLCSNDEETDIPMESAYDVSSAALLPASRAMELVSRFTLPPSAP
jgi:hypothetical protein